MATNVAIYIRVSTNHQIDRDSLPMQRQDLIAYSKFILHADSYKIFEDAGYSGKNTDRPQYQAMMSDVRNGLFTHILVWKIDRISRNLLDFAAMYDELKRLGVVFVSKNEQFDTSSAMGEAMLKIILVFAELERNMTAERVTATMISRAANGQWNGGRIPYGYTYDADKKEFAINNEEAKIVRLMYDLYESFKSLIAVARHLNESGYCHRSGVEWTPTTVSIILKSAFYTGAYRYNMRKDGCRQKEKAEKEWITIENHHPAIVSKARHELVLSILHSNFKLATTQNFIGPKWALHVFANLIFCSKCGSQYCCTTYGQKGMKSISRYYCPTRRKNIKRCNNISINDITVGNFVFNYIANMLRAEKDAKDIQDLDVLSSVLLRGFTFSYIRDIAFDDLNNFYKLIHASTSNGHIYNMKIEPVAPSSNNEPQVSVLLSERRKNERAMERLTNAYLYSDTALSEKEFIVQKERISKTIQDIDSKLAELQSIDSASKISDEEFLSKASEFIITQKLLDRNFISYERLAKTTDKNLLREFVVNTIERIMIFNGKIESITFRNGLTQRFIFK